MGDLPDWTNAVLLQGETDAGDVITLLVGDDGQLYAYLVGEDSVGTLHPVRTDTTGQLIIKLVGDLGVPLGVDSDGYLTAVSKGEDGVGALRTLAVDTSGQLIMVPRGQSGNYMAVDASGFLSAILKGTDDEQGLHSVLVDDFGQIIMVPRGQSGYYMAVDASGFLSAILKGTDDEQGLHSVLVDDFGQIIMVPRGQSGYYMAVDSDGYLTMILKGAEDGVLTTIAVDAQGRIEAFILDAENQWGSKVKVGNAELAARLGALKTWDWRGQVAWQSDFSRGMGNALKYPTGDGASITIDPTYWLTGGYSVKMVGGSDGDHKAYMDFLIETPASLSIGLEGTFSYVDQMEFFKLEIRCYTDGKIYTAAVRHNRSTNYVQYLNSSNVWTNIANPYYLTGPEMFHRLKLVVDFDAVLYDRVLYGNTEVDLSAQGVYQSGTGFSSALYIEVELNSRSGENDVAYLDSLILTTKEP